MASDMKQTCGPLYKAGLEEFTGMDSRKIPIFAAGFISGEAEKIYLGACSAAMFRPSADWFDRVFNICHQVARRYELLVRVLDTTKGCEIWILRSNLFAEMIVQLAGYGENTAEWHRVRGRLCGVPEHELDSAFHERSGFGERCD